MIPLKLMLCTMRIVVIVEAKYKKSSEPYHLIIIKPINIHS